MGHLIAYVIFKHYFLSSQKTVYCYFVLCQEYLEGCLAVTSPVHHHKHIIIYPSLQCPWAGTQMKPTLNLLKSLAKFLSYSHTPHSVYGCWFSSTLILCITKVYFVNSKWNPRSWEVLSTSQKKAPPECRDFFLPHGADCPHEQQGLHFVGINYWLGKEVYIHFRNTSQANCIGSNLAFLLVKLPDYF